MAAVSRRLVIDASVASAAGQTLQPASRRCREFLRTVLRICHRTTMTPRLREEWRRHQSLFAKAWLAEMRSRAKAEDVADVRNEEMRDQAPGTPSAQKDLHLIEAALNSDRIVISLDDRARAELSVPAAAEVMWVNPVSEGGHAIYWLNKGAAPVKEWMLGQD
jgi:hypothetical protein